MVKLQTNKCIVCGKDFKNSSHISIESKLKYPIDDYFKLCSTHRKRKKNCPVCGTLHYNQGVACCSDHAYFLKQESWIRTTGKPHNFCKGSKSRLEWEARLLEEEGICNVYQRDAVKDKIKLTISKKYNNGVAVDNISQTQYWKNATAFVYIQKYGIDAYIDKQFKNSTDRNIYYKNVWSITISQLKKLGSSYLGYAYSDIKEYNKKCDNIKNYLTIDHKYSIIRGFIEKIPPTIIGDICNLDIIKYTDNSAKGSKCSVTLTELQLKIQNKNG